MSSESDLRQRTATKEAVTNGKTTPGQKEERKARAEQQAKQAGMSVIEIIRIITALAIVGAIASYLITRGESWIFGLKRPWWTKPKLMQAALKPQLELTNEELAAYDGSDPEKPILLGLNRTIYDVSASPGIYGPAGPYHKLVGKDASRSFVTTCFDPKEDLVPYLGGVEEVFVPLWLSTKPTQKELDRIAKGEIMDGMGLTGVIDSIQKNLGRKKSRLMREEAYAVAKDKVRDKIKTWEGMFEKKEYPVVGRVVGVDEEDESKWKNLKLCEEALAQRPPLAESMSKVMQMVGRKDGKVDLGMMKKSVKKSAKQKDDIRNSEDQRKAEMANAKHDDMRDEGKYGGEGRKKAENKARSEERQRRREERKAEIAARKGMKKEDVSDQLVDALEDTVVDQ